MISYGKQDINQQDIKAVIDVLESEFLTQGPKIAEFEQQFADYVGAKFAVAVTNGTAALHLACLALNVDNTTQVITTPITFAATANSVLYCGGKVEFSDIDDQVLIDLDKLETLLSISENGTYQGVIPVQYAGASVDMERLNDICKDYGLWIIEDASHAPGGYFLDSKGNRQRCGNGVFADLSVFSFHPVKHIACGEGGMLTTNDEVLYRKLLSLRSHGITRNPDELTENHGGWYYELQQLGFNYRLSEINCALGISQLKRAAASLAKRKTIARKYDKAFDALGIDRLAENKGHAYHLYVILTDKRKQLYDFLKDRKITTQVHYIPLHLQPYYKKLGWKKGDMPNAENYYEQCLSIPMYPTLSINEQDYVIEQISCFQEQHG